MIKLQDLTPQVYYNQSRDFQFIGRLYDIVLNYVKTNADIIYNLPCGKNMDEKLLNLLAFTLGFQSKHHYNAKQLRAVCSVLPTILKHKGSLQAIFDAVNAMLYAEDIKEPLDYKLEAKTSLTLYLPQQLSDLTLLRDLLVYILPAGLSCNLVKELKKVVNIHTELTVENKVTIRHDSARDQILQLQALSLSPVSNGVWPNDRQAFFTQTGTGLPVVETTATTTEETSGESTGD